MTDKELTPDQAGAVRRLLAGARHDEPMPEDVAGRLDGVLADLVAERAATGAEVPPVVVPLRRRRWPRILVAAASVCALGLGATQVLGEGDGSDGSAGEGTPQSRDLIASDNRQGSGDALTGGEDPGDEPAYAPGVPSEPGAEAEDRAAKNARTWENSAFNLDGVPLTAMSEFARNLERADRGPLQLLTRRHLPSALSKLHQHVEGAAADDIDRYGFSGRERDAAYDALIAPRTCGPVYTVVGGKATYATYHGKLALVIFHPELHGAQLVELYVCSGRTPRRSVERVTLWDGE